MKLKTGPTGKIVQGHVLDVSRKPLERAMRDYDSLLYVKWNPHKLLGWGMWEIRRRPEKKSVVDGAEFQGVTYSRLEYAELNIVNHVLDVPFLNYSVLAQIKEMDTWNDKYWVHDLDYREAKHREKEESKIREEAIYSFKQHKNILKAWKELILSGHNPAELAKYWDSK